MSQAMAAIIKNCQANEFAQELHNFRNQSQVNLKSKLTTLHPILDSDGIIRVGGRLRYAPIEYCRMFPIVLPSKYRFTEVVIRNAHYNNLHAEPQAILATVCNQYWPIAGKVTIHRVLRKCMV